jgi:hypothetical protein
VYAHNCVLIRIYNYYCYYIYTHSQRETWEETFDFGNGRYGVRVNLPFHQSIDSFFFHQWFISGCFSHRMEHAFLWKKLPDYGTIRTLKIADRSHLVSSAAVMPIVRIWFPINMEVS